jgi:hypothetical protein
MQYIFVNVWSINQDTNNQGTSINDSLRYANIARVVRSEKGKKIKNQGEDEMQVDLISLLLSHIVHLPYSKLGIITGPYFNGCPNAPSF